MSRYQTQSRASEGTHSHSCGSLTSVTIPPTVSSCPAYMFAYCGSLTNVVIPNSVTSIGSWAFSHCSNLNELRIPDSVVGIEQVAFSYCLGLSNVVVGNGRHQHTQPSFLLVH